MVTSLRGRAATTYPTYESARFGTDLRLAETSLAVLAENLLLLRAVEQAGRLRRFCSIMPMRFSDHDHRLYGYTVEAGPGMLMTSAPASASARTPNPVETAAAPDAGGRS